MKKLYKLIFLSVLLLGTGHLFSQREVIIEPSEDPSSFIDIFPVIMGDTTETGERVDENTIYKLRNGSVYVVSDRLNNKGWPLQIEADDLENTALKPVMSVIPNASGSYPQMIFAEGNMTLKNLWIVSGETGPLENSRWGQIRLIAPHIRVKVDNCLIEKDRGGFIQVRADSTKVYISNSEFRNGGNRRLIQGNGRGFDARNFALDTLVMRNTIVYNCIDRFFRSQGGTVPHNYIEIDHCTAFNIMGRHGFIQLGRAFEVKITNNLFMNPIMLGTTPVLTDEQTQPDSDQHKVITIDTLYENTNLTISNNNIFWDQEVIDHWATIDTVSAPPVLSALVMENLGDAAADAYFSEPLSLNSVPMSALQYVIDLYADPTSEEMFDIIVEDIVREGTAFDSGNLFDFSTFDQCYSETTMSANADTEGDAIGAVADCDNLRSSVEKIPFNLDLGLKAAPNPAMNATTLTFNTKVEGQVDLRIFDHQGRLIQILVREQKFPGNHSVVWNNLESVPAGMYYTQLTTSEGRMFVKLVVQ